MALIDNQNKVIYWDEVNWQWLPFVQTHIRKTKVSLILQYKGVRTSINSKKEVIDFIRSKGFILTPISNLGIIEVSLGSYLYNGKIYENDREQALRSLPILLSIISGKSKQLMSKNLEGVGILSKAQLDNMVSKGKHIEFRGKVYKSYSELSRDYGFSTAYLSKWLSRGMSLEEIVSNYKGKKVIVDHLGVKYSCLGEMLNKYGITLKAYKKRSYRGWSLERTLTTPIKDTQVATECVDFNGKVFPSMKALCNEYGVSHASILYHTRRGKTTEEALKILLSPENFIYQVKDHLGNSFSSKVEMAEHWKVNYDTFRDRIKRGWSLEESLTGKRRER